MRILESCEFVSYLLCGSKRKASHPFQVSAKITKSLQASQQPCLNDGPEQAPTSMDTKTPINHDWRIVVSDFC
jgi:hypothetical protein